MKALFFLFLVNIPVSYGQLPVEKLNLTLMEDVTVNEYKWVYSENRNFAITCRFDSVKKEEKVTLKKGESFELTVMENDPNTISAVTTFSPQHDYISKIVCINYKIGKFKELRCSPGDGQHYVSSGSDLLLFNKCALGLNRIWKAYEQNESKLSIEDLEHLPKDKLFFSTLE